MIPRLHYCLFVCLFVLGYACAAQPNVDLQATIETLSADVAQGNKRALRDLASLLDITKGEQRKSIVKTIDKYTLFSTNHPELDKSSDQFLDFFYTHYKDLQFSYALNVFITEEIETLPYEVEISFKDDVDDYDSKLAQLGKFVKKFEEAKKKNKHKVCASVIQEIGKLSLSKSQEFLTACVYDNEDLPKEVYASISKSLKHFPDEQNTELIFELFEQNKINEATAYETLVYLFNYHPEMMEQLEKNDVQSFKKLIDSLNSVDEVRLLGYQKVVGFNLTYFDDPTDFYGYVLNQAYQYDWVAFNAYNDLLSTEESKSLFYMSSLIFNQYNDGNRENAQVALDRLINLTGTILKVKDAQGNWTDDILKDDRTILNFICFWAQNYNAFEWVTEKGRYENIDAAKEKEARYDTYFRRLTSPNDSVAIKSFVKLTEGEPHAVIELADNYRTLLSSTNAKIPSMRYYYLEVLVRLVQFSKQNEISYQLRGETKYLVDQLIKGHVDEKTRYSLENRILETLTFEQANALEYTALLNEYDKAFSYSASKILDVYYSENWEEIFENPDHLRFFIFKGLNYSSIGAIGVCNNYLNKFKKEIPALKDKIQFLIEAETNLTIKDQLEALIAQSDTESGDDASPLESFFDFPSSYSQRDFRMLPKPTLDDYILLSDYLLEYEDGADIKAAFNFIRYHADLIAVPAVMPFIGDDMPVSTNGSNPLKVQDFALFALEDIYKFTTPGASKDEQYSFWMDKWETDAERFDKWTEDFFALKIEALSSAETISIDDINNLVNSKEFNPETKADLFNSFDKLEDANTLRNLVLDDKLPQTDLKYFKNLAFEYKYLDDVIRKFEVKTVTKDLTQFILDQTAQYSMYEKGLFFNRLFNLSWLDNYVTSMDADTAFVNVVIGSLGNYLTESEISEYEEQEVLLKIAKMEFVGKTLVEQFELLNALDNLPDELLFKIQENILSKITFDQLGEIASLYDEFIVIEGKNPYRYLYEDFGIPIYDFKTQRSINIFIENHKTKSQKEFYMHYLGLFGVDFQKKNGDLDYEKIYRILKYDYVMPFASSEGGIRDNITYGIIKILEQEFETTLAFHEKLNESQLVYTHHTSTRTKAWVKYLKDNKLIKEDKALPSFHQEWL